jgi:NADPH-dependent 2,4-dienoyl-CoA reductase/sulfur reductase-like enzyme
MNTLQTSAKDVYALGDCAELSHPRSWQKSIEAVWYTGRMMGKTIAQTICDKPTKYNPGIWFNSAKFFDIEYQVYGDIPTKYLKILPVYIGNIHLKIKPYVSILKIIRSSYRFQSVWA